MVEKSGIWKLKVGNLETKRAIMDIVMLLIQVFLGIILYICFSIVLKIDSFNYILLICKSLLSRRKH